MDGSERSLQRVAKPLEADAVMRVAKELRNLEDIGMMRAVIQWKLKSLDALKEGAASIVELGESVVYHAANLIGARPDRCSWRQPRWTALLTPA